LQQNRNNGLKTDSLFVRRFIQPRCISQEETFHIGELPARVIEKEMPGPGLLFQIICDSSLRTCPFIVKRNAMSN
jgi:hypothetical protein